MVTDPQRRRLSDPGRPEVCNVFTLHGVFSPDDVAQIEVDCRNADIGCVQCKKLFAKNLADYFAPFRARRAELASNPERVWGILHDGAERAATIASDVMAEVREAMQLP
jgi:tryptophanyl-tRNA synthetase